MQAPNPNLAEASDLFLRTHVRDTFTPFLWTALGPQAACCESPASNAALCYRKFKAEPGEDSSEGLVALNIAILMTRGQG